MAREGTGLLGPLEGEVMEALWASPKPLSVRTVLERLNEGRRLPLAYTTVMTVLDSLHRKSWVLREMDARAYRYRPAFSRAEAAAKALREVLDSSGDPEAVLLHFARSVSDNESTVLRRELRRKSTR